MKKRDTDQLLILHLLLEIINKKHFNRILKISNYKPQDAFKKNKLILSKYIVKQRLVELHINFVRIKKNYNYETNLNV